MGREINMRENLEAGQMDDGYPLTVTGRKEWVQKNSVSVYKWLGSGTFTGPVSGLGQ